MAANEAGGGRLLHHDVNDIFAVKVAGLAQEGLFAEVVVLFPVGEIPGVAAIGLSGQLGRDGPAGKGPGGLPHVHLGVVADAHGEELQQFPTPVLIYRVTVIFIVIQPENHCRILGKIHDQVPIVTHALLAEHINLDQHLVAVIQLGVSGGENVVPEKSHLFFQGLVGADHIIKPVGLTHYRVPAGEQATGVITQQQLALAAVPFGRGINQVFNHCVVAFSYKLFQLVPVSAKTGTSHQVRHQRKVFFV